MRQQLGRLDNIIQHERVPRSPMAQLGYALNRVPTGWGRNLQKVMVGGSLLTMTPIIGKILINDGHPAHSMV
jgi:hypothetical protein